MENLSAGDIIFEDMKTNIVHFVNKKTTTLMKFPSESESNDDVSISTHDDDGTENAETDDDENSENSEDDGDGENSENSEDDGEIKEEIDAKVIAAPEYDELLKTLQMKGQEECVAKQKAFEKTLPEQLNFRMMFRRMRC